jgi:hypothetical protein
MALSDDESNPTTTLIGLPSDKGNHGYYDVWEICSYCQLELADLINKHMPNFIKCDVYNNLLRFKYNVKDLKEHTEKNKGLRNTIGHIYGENEDDKNIMTFYQQELYVSAFIITGIPKGAPILIPSKNESFDDFGSGQFYPAIMSLIDDRNMINGKAGWDITYQCPYNASNGVLFIYEKTKYYNIIRFVIIFLVDNKIMLLYESIYNKNCSRMTKILQSKVCNGRYSSCREQALRIVEKEL